MPNKEETLNKVRQYELAKKEKAKAKRQAEKVAMQRAFNDFIPRIEKLLEARTNQTKMKTGRHCSEAMLQKYARETFESLYGIDFDNLTGAYQVNIYTKVIQTHHILKIARES